MKKIFTGALAFLLLAGAASAQTKESKDHQHRGADYKKELNLSADQQAQLKSLHQEQRKEMETLKANTSISQEQQKALILELRKKYSDRTKAIYTPAQNEQIEKMRSEMKAKGKEGRKEGKFRKGKEGKENASRKGDRFEKELSLSQDQKDQLARLRSEARSQAESIRNDASLSEDQKKEKLLSVRKKQQESMKSILTKEQAEKMKAGRKEHKNKAKK